jgi:hypothetical protein
MTRLVSAAHTVQDDSARIRASRNSFQKQRPCLGCSVAAGRVAIRKRDGLAALRTVMAILLECEDQIGCHCREAGGAPKFSSLLN